MNRGYIKLKTVKSTLAPTAIFANAAVIPGAIHAAPKSS
jgi:hypothetical protein